MQTKSDHIRKLHGEGCSTSKIAAELGIRYQHAYNVIKRANMRPIGATSNMGRSHSKPGLDEAKLLESGFRLLGGWMLDDDGNLALSVPVPTDPGVYAFIVDESVLYVGVATIGLRNRFYSYKRPGVSQRTSLRLNKAIKSLLRNSKTVEILIASPGREDWNGLPVNSAAGLELGLIQHFDLPWNQRH